MNKYQETFNTWNKVAKVYEEKFMYLDIYNYTYDTFLNSLPKENSHVLELGCGPGNICQYLKSQNNSLSIYGLDISENMIVLAKKNNPVDKFEVMDTREINNITTTFDGIITGFCIPYLSEKEVNSLIQNAYNLLNKNGVIYLSFVEGENKKSGFVSSSEGGRMYFNYHNLKKIVESLQKNNFNKPRKLEVKYPNKENSFDVHTILIAKKK